MTTLQALRFVLLGDQIKADTTAGARTVVKLWCLTAGAWLHFVTLRA